MINYYDGALLRIMRAPSLTVLSIIIFIIFSSTCLAIPQADGKFDPSEGYTIGYNVNFSVEGTGPVSDQGQLWLYIDPIFNDLYVAFIQPLTIVDNTYGANTIGWPGNNHKFKHLHKSDQAQFVITNEAGNVVLDFFIDYLEEITSGTTYESTGPAGKDGKMNVGNASSIKAWGTSLEYNFNTLGFVLTTNSPATNNLYDPNPAFPGWIFEVVYEVQIDGALFDVYGVGDVRVPLVHDSPTKLGGDKVFYIDKELIVPEPLTIILMSIGSALLCIFRRKK